ncbi:hypothetical protein [Serratia fonticola]|uniref:hypothetical protein n=1 Tax=Serratia fonticola TaxID=47917 RepID=UPI00217971CA|nr:hypothetical protein [Serratia fonticola]CAI1728612.1 Uncharacterised protein [Serratia fonticola]
MKESDLVFEKVGDINATYPYLCVYDKEDSINPFMEIAVTDDQQLQYTIYAGNRNIVLNAWDWECVQRKAQEFMPRAIANEEGF